MASVLFGVSSADAPVIAIAVGGVGISALAAALGPLRRAVRLEPAVALRRE
jgi:ABC-type antimicrobial peptide transport system permease subunit